MTLDAEWRGISTEQRTVLIREYEKLFSDTTRQLPVVDTLGVVSPASLEMDLRYAAGDLHNDVTKLLEADGENIFFEFPVRRFVEDNAAIMFVSATSGKLAIVQGAISESINRRYRSVHKIK